MKIFQRMFLSGSSDRIFEYTNDALRNNGLLLVKLPSFNIPIVSSKDSIQQKAVINRTLYVRNALPLLMKYSSLYNRNFLSGSIRKRKVLPVIFKEATKINNPSNTVKQIKRNLIVFNKPLIINTSVNGCKSIQVLNKIPLKTISLPAIFRNVLN